MRATDGIEIRLLDESDIPRAMRLKEAAGWNQTETDWRCLLTLEPNGCFGAICGGQLVATTTTTTYEDELAWIGMVLVDPEKRRSGIATRLLETALDYLSSRVSTVKLDATPLGQPVYEQFGFQAESMIERWTGTAGRKGIAEDAESIDNNSRFELFALDRRVFRADRSRLLEMLLNNSSVPPVMARGHDGSLRGYAFARRGSNAAYVGPVVTMSAGDPEPLLDHLLGGILSRLKDQRIYIDFNKCSDCDVSALASRGFVKERELVRMSYGKPDSSTSPFIFAIAGPEVG